jgi:hypothetical protein
VLLPANDHCGRANSDAAIVDKRTCFGDHDTFADTQTPQSPHLIAWQIRAIMMAGTQLIGKGPHRGGIDRRLTDVHGHVIREIVA